MLEKEAGYPGYRSIGYSDEDIARHLRKNHCIFERVAVLVEKMGCTWDDYVPESYSEPV